MRLDGIQAEGSENGQAEALLAFLRGTKTSEALQALGHDLPRHLYVPTRDAHSPFFLEDALAAALVDGRSVVVAGSAGSGKSMFIEAIVDRAVSSGVRAQRYRPEAGDTSDADVLIIPDLTEVSVGLRAKLLSSTSKRRQVLVGANEGALLDAELTPPFDCTLKDLHALQNGRNPGRAGSPIVVDLAGIEPLKTGLSSILQMPLLHEAARLWEQSPDNPDPCLEPDCPRLRTLDQLRNGDIAREVSLLLQAALGPSEVLYRDLWDFVADIFLGGSCESITPSSAWFWRVFRGRSSLSRRLRQVVDPAYLNLPDISAPLYFGDWRRATERLARGPLFVEPTFPPATLNPEISDECMTWLQIQATFLAHPSNSGYGGGEVAHEFLGTAQSDTTRSVTQGDKTLLIQALNAYHRITNPEPGDPDGLELWLDLRVERRTERSNGLVCVGIVPPSELSLVRSLTVANCPSINFEGSRLYLSHSLGEGARPQLRVDERLFEALGRGRTTRTYDRANDDVDMALWTFFTDLSRAESVASGELRVLLFTSAFSDRREYRWRVSERSITALGGQP